MGSRVGFYGWVVWWGSRDLGSRDLFQLGSNHAKWYVFNVFVKGLGFLVSRSVIDPLAVFPPITNSSRPLVFREQLVD